MSHRQLYWWRDCTVSTFLENATVMVAVKMCITSIGVNWLNGDKTKLDAYKNFIFNNLSGKTDFVHRKSQSLRPHSKHQVTRNESRTGCGINIKNKILKSLIRQQSPRYWWHHLCSFPVIGSKANSLGQHTHTHTHTHTHIYIYIYIWGGRWSHTYT